MQHRPKMLIYSNPLQNKTNKRIAATFFKTKGQNICRRKTQVSYNRLAYFSLSCKGLDFFPYSFYKSTSYPSLQYKFYSFILAKHRRQTVYKTKFLWLFYFHLCSIIIVSNSYKQLPLFFYHFSILFYQCYFISLHIT